MAVLEAIENRRSVRQYKQQKIEREKIEKILQAGICAPSGKNGQPWRFYVIREDKETLRKIAKLSGRSVFVAQADCVILVYLDKDSSYNYVKDAEAIGACIENMLLAAEAFGLGACWVGETVNRAAEVNELLQLESRYEFMALISLGYPLQKNTPCRTARKRLQDVILGDC